MSSSHRLRLGINQNGSKSLVQAEHHNKGKIRIASMRITIFGARGEGQLVAEILSSRSSELCTKNESKSFPHNAVLLLREVNSLARRTQL